MRFKDTLRISDGLVFLLGNEAIARGALEGGIGLASAYPGTPSSEIVESLMKVKDELDIYVEWSVNEKVAFEVAYAAAISGVRSLVAMKHVGLNVAADPLMSSAYTGVKNGFVIVSADDPSMWSSQNEQDNRFYGLHAYIPVFEPCDPSEAKELTKFALEFSSEMKHPVILRTTTRISHSRGPVKLGEIPKPVTKGHFDKDWRYVLIPANARRNRLSMLKRWEAIEDAVNNTKFNKIEGEGGNLIIASGISYSHVRESIDMLGVRNKVKILKIATTHPIPEKLLLKSLENTDKILVVEELEPFIETHVRNLLYNEGIRIPIYGKKFTGIPFELTLPRVTKAIAEFLGIPYTLREVTNNKKIDVPPRPPALCPGCPYRPLFFELRRYINQEKLSAVLVGDIGCYSLGYNPPFKVQDIIIEMGGSIGVGNGLSRVIDDVVISLIGDSTFFHAGIPPLINAVYNEAPLIVIVLDNEITAMTGHQPSPSTRISDRGRSVLIENVVKGIGVKYVRTIDPFNINEFRLVLKEAINHVKDKRQPAVIIARRRCALQVSREIRIQGIEVPSYIVDEVRCIGCKICYDWFSCPAISPKENNKAWIDPELCIGCSACVQVCPVNAIKPAKQYDIESVEKLWR
jgi:indolepyruvate ferredoxin oxidoreductase alpha subunit